MVDAQRHLGRRVLIPGKEFARISLGDASARLQFCGGDVHPCMFSDGELPVKRNVLCQCDDPPRAAPYIFGMAKNKKKEPGPFGVNLKDRRTRVGMTMEVLAAAAQVSKGYISSLETGAKANPSEGMARRFADALQCEVADLWGRDQSSFEVRALELLRHIPETRREAAIAALYGLASQAA